MTVETIMDLSVYYVNYPLTPLSFSNSPDMKYYQIGEFLFTFQCVVKYMFLY